MQNIEKKYISETTFKDQDNSNKYDIFTYVGKQSRKIFRLL
jgi:hypothetical protein